MLQMEIPEKKTEAKMELMARVSELMPAGKPDFLSMVKYPKVVDLVKEHGRMKIHTVLFLMVKDFCSSMNVVRNMNEDQMIEVAAMLIDEADNFRLEDYTIFFSMAKRGMLGKIYDRVDTQVISQLLDEYWNQRREKAYQAEQDPVKHYDSLGSTTRAEETINPQDAKLMNMAEGLAGAIGELKTRFKEWTEEQK
jgi:hypothetical protein